MVPSPEQDPIPAADLELIINKINEIMNEKGLTDVSAEIQDTKQVGENYLTDVFIISATGHKGAKQFKHSFFVKSLKLAFDENALDMDMEICKNEVFAYTSVFKEIAAIEKKHGILDGALHAEFVYYLESVDNKSEYLVLGDLASKDFKTGDRMTRLDIHHMKVAINELALYHGASFAMKATDISKYTQLTEGLEDKMSLFYGPGELMINMQIEKVTSIINDEDVKSKFKRIGSKLKESVQELRERSSAEPHEAIGHGDVWTSNIMFQYDSEGLPKRAVIVDWQFLRCHSPVLDLFHLLVTSPAEELLTTEQFKYFLDYYYERLRRAIAAYSLRVEELFPEEAYRAHLKRYAPMGIYTGLMMLFYHMRVSDDLTSPAEVIARPESSTRMSPESERRYSDMWNFTLNSFNECGFFDTES